MINELPRTLPGIQRQCDEDSRLWFPKVYAQSLDQVVAYLSLAQCGEAGELANKLKKVLRGDRDLMEARQDLAEENMDVFIYTMNLFTALGIGDIATLYHHKRTVNAERFGGKHA